MSNKNKEIAAFITGKRLYLREVRSSDAQGSYYRWMNDPEVTRHLESFCPHSRQELEDYVLREAENANSVFLAIILKDNDQHIGNIKLGPINWIHRRGDIGLMIGEKECWGKGYASEAIQLVVTYAFENLNLHKLTAGCYSEHIASQKAFEKNRFQVEGIRKQHGFKEGKYRDMTLLGLIHSAEEKHEKQN